MIGSIRRLTEFMLIFYSCNSQLVVDYNVVPCNADLSRLATLVWLKPAQCLFEMWAAQGAGQMTIDRSSVSITVEILREDNNTFVLTWKYPVPPCIYFFPEPAEMAYQMGPSIVDKNGSRIEHVLPGQSFRIRYILSDLSTTPLVMTRWSDSITTRDDPLTYLSIQVWDVGMRSHSMVVITVLLLMAIFLLLVGLTATMTVR